ncbi:MAG: protein kinase [Minicystis sp.]
MALNLSAGTLVAERFRLERILGQGGMGAVWLAHHVGLDIACAIKFIHAEAAASPEIRGRFEREARAAAQLRSPHVVQILDNGVWEGAPYIAMEYLEGEDLAQRLRRLGRLDPRATVDFVSQVGRALAKAHAAGLVHRDLKPANIFISRDDEREIFKVLDFGVAKSNAAALGLGEGSKTKTGSLLGTPFYMSPEQAQGRSVDHRTDLWALAVVVYQCLTGHLPFKGEALGDLFVKIIVNPLPVPSQVADVPAPFDAWWARAASRDPEQRFQSAKELVEALSIALGLSAGAVTGLVTSGIIPAEAQPASGQPFPAQQPNVGSWPNPSAPSSAVDLPTVKLEPAPGRPDSGANFFPQTAAPIVAAVRSNPSLNPARSLVGPIVAVALSFVALAGAIAFFAFRPSGSSAASEVVVQPSVAATMTQVVMASARPVASDSSSWQAEAPPTAVATASSSVSVALPAPGKPAAVLVKSTPSATPSAGTKKGKDFGF